MAMDPADRRNVLKQQIEARYTRVNRLKEEREVRARTRPTPDGPPLAARERGWRVLTAARRGLRRRGG